MKGSRSRKDEKIVKWKHPIKNETGEFYKILEYIDRHWGRTNIPNYMNNFILNIFAVFNLDPKIQIEKVLWLNDLLHKWWLMNYEWYFRVNEIAGDLAKCMHEKSQDRKFYEASIKEIVQFE